MAVGVLRAPDHVRVDPLDAERNRLGQVDGPIRLDRRDMRIVAQRLRGGGGAMELEAVHRMAVHVAEPAIRVLREPRRLGRGICAGNQGDDPGVARQQIAARSPRKGRLVSSRGARRREERAEQAEHSETRDPGAPAGRTHRQDLRGGSVAA